MKLPHNILFTYFLFFLLSACSEETITPGTETAGIHGELKSGINQKPIKGARVYLLDRNTAIGPHGPWGTMLSDIKYIYIDSTDTDINGKFSFGKELSGKIGIYISDPRNKYSLVDGNDQTLVNMDSTTYEYIELEAVPVPTRDSFEIELEIYNVIDRNYFGQIQEDYFLTHPIKISSFRSETQFGIVSNSIPLETHSILSNSTGVINVKFRFIKGYSDIFYSLNNSIKFIAHEMDDINDIYPDREYIYVSLPLYDTLSYRKYTVDYHDIDEFYGQVRFSE
nr:hypothetical protein [uncultured Draconibacterium sp.]